VTESENLKGAISMIGYFKAQKYITVTCTENNSTALHS